MSVFFMFFVVVAKLSEQKFGQSFVCLRRVRSRTAAGGYFERRSGVCGKGMTTGYGATGKSVHQATLHLLHLNSCSDAPRKHPVMAGNHAGTGGAAPELTHKEGWSRIGQVECDLTP